MRASSVETVAAGALPSPPAIVLKVVQQVSSPDCALPDLSQLIAADPSLSAALLQSVNSAYYRPKQPVTTVQRAVALLGLQAVRNLVLCIAARGLFAPPEGFPIERFWEISLRRAASAKLLAQHLGDRDGDELFTLGLLQDIGVLTATTLHPDLAPELTELLTQPLRRRLHRERELGVPHDALGQQLLHHWQLDEAFVAPVGAHHGQAKDPSGRAEILAAADALADLVVVEDKLIALADVEARLGKLGIGATQLSELLGDIDAVIAVSAEMLGISTGPQPELSDIMAAAAMGLADVTMGYQQAVKELQSSLERERAMAEQLEVLNERLRCESSTDPLTGLANRRALDKELERAIAQARRQKVPMSVLMIDADHFKAVNDAHGHAGGDLVLQRLAQAIHSSLRRSDFLARIGGEELVAVLPFTDLAGARVAAERIRREVEELRVSWRDTELRVTVSIGCAEVEHLGDAEAARLLLRHADEALYAAKAQGRNCVQTA